MPRVVPDVCPFCIMQYCIHEKICTTAVNRNHNQSPARPPRRGHGQIGPIPYVRLGANARHSSRLLRTPCQCRRSNSGLTVIGHPQRRDLGGSMCRGIPCCCTPAGQGPSLAPNGNRRPQSIQASVMPSRPAADRARQSLQTGLL